MSDTQIARCQCSAEPAKTHQPLHVILSYLLGTWTDMLIFGANRTSPIRKEPRR